MTVLDGKVAIVTGAGQGVGRAHALELARQGARVIVNDLGTDRAGEGAGERFADQVVEEIEAAGGVAEANYENVADWDGGERLIQQAVDSFGQLDILVNNAGILRDRMSFKMTEDEWDAVINVHLKGHFVPSRAAAIHWRQRSKAGEDVYGRIINTSSEAGLFGNPGQANYAAAKAGIVGLTLVFARELQKIGVTANAIAPRALTRMTEDLMAPLLENVDEGDFNPVDPDNISPLVSWLASPDAAHVSAQLFIIWGDEIQHVNPHTLAGTIKAGGRRFEVDELTAAMEKLFDGRDPGVPPFGVQPA